MSTRSRFKVITFITRGLFLTLAAPAICAPILCAEIMEPRLDSAVEVETILDARTIELFTTPNNKVSGFTQGVALREELASYLASKYKITDPVNLDWLSLEPKERLAIVTDIDSKRPKSAESFFKNREYPGLIVRKGVGLQRGKIGMFPDGEQIPLDDFQPKVEYANAAQNSHQIELHLRGKKSPDELSVTAAAVEKQLRGKASPQHVHILSRMPRALPRAIAEKAAFRIVEYFRRVNLYLELSTLEGKQLVDKVELLGRSIEDSDGFFLYKPTFENRIYYPDGTYRMLAGSLGPGSLSKIYSWLVDEMQKPIGAASQPLKDEFKIAAVGFRGTDSYDQENVFGFEVRQLIQPEDPKTKKL